MNRYIRFTFLPEMMRDYHHLLCYSSRSANDRGYDSSSLDQSQKSALGGISHCRERWEDRAVGQVKVHEQGTREVAS